MGKRPFTQDVRASLTLLITDDILTNNHLLVPADPGRGIPATYAEWDDTLENVHFNSFRDDDNLYLYVPAGTRSSENRTVDKDFVESFLKGMDIVVVNGYYLSTLSDSNKWTYQSNRSFERATVESANPTWRGYNMVSQWYWLSSEDMFDQPEYIECACWSIPKADISDATVVSA